MENQEKESLQESINVNEIGASGMPIPSNWNSLSYSQRKLYFNYYKPSLGQIYYQLNFKNGSVRFGKSKAKSNFNFETVKKDLFAAWPKLESVNFIDTEEQYLELQKQNKGNK